MSAHQDNHDAHAHDDHHDDEGPHSTVKGYTIGFVLSVILTVIPFWLVMGKVFESSSTTARAPSTTTATVRLVMTLAMTSLKGMAVRITDSTKPIM